MAAGKQEGSCRTLVPASNSGVYRREMFRLIDEAAARGGRDRVEAHRARQAQPKSFKTRSTYHLLDISSFNSADSNACPLHFTASWTPYAVVLGTSDSD